MKKINFKILLFTLLLFVSAQSYATELKFDGSIGYKFDKDKVTIFADKIMNKSMGGKSGSIKVAIYATDAPYEIGGIYGYVLGEHTFENQLYGQYNFIDVQKTVEYKEPPIGKYFITIALLEYDGSDFKLTDYASFKQPVLFGLTDEVEKVLEEQKKDEVVADQDKNVEQDDKKKKEDEYRFKDDLRTQALLTVLVLGGLRHMINVP